MNRAACYQAQIVNKLLSSKFLCPGLPGAPFASTQKLIIKGAGKARNPEVSASTLTVSFGQRPTFDRALRRQEKEYLLIHLTLTANRGRVASNLDRLASLILPFQLENKMLTIKGRAGGEGSWTIKGCTPPAPLYPLLFPYPISDERFNLTVFFLTGRGVSPCLPLFYLNLFQLPVAPAAPGPQL